jgi:hypothetical protein
MTARLSWRPEGEFELLETDMTDPKGDENVICSAMPTR